MYAYQRFATMHQSFPAACHHTAIPHVIPQPLQGVVCWLAMCGVQQAVQQRLGTACASAFMLLTAMQFHLPFYMSRTLPNTFATAVLGLALADWVTGRHPKRLIALLALATVSLHSFPLYCLRNHRS